MKQEGSKRGTTGTLREIVLAHSESFRHSSLHKDFLNIFMEDKLEHFSKCMGIYLYVYK